MSDLLKTERLYLTQLNTEDSHFIFQLLNSPGWITYIGNRNIDSLADAENYIDKINKNPNVTYWVVKLSSDGRRIGIITFIKRDYLEYHDIGFAFLPDFEKKGYAYEAAQIILTKVHTENPIVLATTKAANINSIRLLEKLGLLYDREIEVDNDPLLVFSTKAVR